MQLRHVSTNLRQGLRRNLSMHVAVVLTLFICLSFGGLGVLLYQQARITNEDIGSELTMKIFLCVPEEQSFPQCTSEVTDQQRQAIIDVVDNNPEVDSYTLLSKQEVFDSLKRVNDNDPAIFGGADPIITVENVPQVIRVQLNDPQEFEGIYSEVEFLDGVRNIQLASDLVRPVFRFIDALKYISWAAAGVLLVSAILLVGNTIRLAALARRKEIEIMRLVGASRLFIGLPFLLEALVTGLIGAALAAGTLAGFQQFVVNGKIDPNINSIPIIDWPEYFWAVLFIVVAAPILTILPTLLMTRKYLRL